MDAYLYVYVNSDGSVREVTTLEKIHLQIKFPFGDGAAPYIKSSYSEKNNGGDLRGYCLRNAIPNNISITHIEEKISKEVIDNEVLRIQSMGYQIISQGIEDIIIEYNINKEHLTDG